jgi:hypothetical protein
MQDGMFEQMDYYSFGAAIIPKAKGAISLHNALKGIDLDFFVMTSSISAVLGNTGQSNYSSANSFLDSLALHRNVNGLAASSLVLPMVLDVGVVAENDSIEQSLLRKGLYGINEQEMLRGFEVAMSAPHPAASLEPSTKVITNSMTSQLIMGMEASELAKSINSIGIDNADLYWFNDARFIHVREALEGSTSNSGNNGGDENFSTVVKAALGQGIDAAVEAIAMYVVKRMSGILMIPIEQFELNGRSLASYGLDSMIGAEMRTWLFKEFGLDYPFQKLLAPTLTFINLATVIGGKMGFIKVTEL